MHICRKWVNYMQPFTFWGFAGGAGYAGGPLSSLTGVHWRGRVMALLTAPGSPPFYLPLNQLWRYLSYQEERKDLKRQSVLQESNDFSGYLSPQV